MKWNWDVTVHTQSERIVTRRVQASTRQVAERKARRKFKVRPYRVRAELAPEQPLTRAQQRAQHEMICQKAGVVD